MSNPNTKTLFDVTSLVADQESDVQDINYQYGYSIQFQWVSSECVATFKMQQSNDGITWNDVTGSDQAIADNSGSVFINLDAQYAKYVRGVIDWTSGVLDSAKAVMNSKG